MPVFYLILTFLSSCLGAITGIGGGIIIRPVMDFISGYSVAAISFLSGVTVLAMTTVSLLKNYRAGQKIEKSQSLPLAVGSIIGGLGGSSLFNAAEAAMSNNALLGVIQTTMLIAMTVTVFIYTFFQNRRSKINSIKLSLIFAAGLGLGCLSAFLGIGGGPLNLAVLSLLFGMSGKTAAINSIFIIFFAQLFSLVFAVTANTVPDVNLLCLLLMIAGGIVGGFIGSSIRQRISDNYVTGLFRLAMVIITVICCINLYNYGMAL